MLDNRAALEVEDLLKIVLLLVIVLLALEVVEAIFSFAVGILGPLLALAIAVLILLWLFDKV